MRAYVSCKDLIVSIRLMTTCCVLMGIGIVGFAFNGIVAAAFILTLVLAVALDLFYPSAVALGMSYIPRHLGMASGLSYGIAVCAGGMAEPFLGLEGDAIGLVPVMLAMSFSAIIVSLAFVTTVRADVSQDIPFGIGYFSYGDNVRESSAPMCFSLPKTT